MIVINSNIIYKDFQNNPILIRLYGIYQSAFSKS